MHFLLCFAIVLLHHCIITVRSELSCWTCKSRNKEDCREKNQPCLLGENACISMSITRSKWSSRENQNIKTTTYVKKCINVPRYGSCRDVCKPHQLFSAECKILNCCGYNLCNWYDEVDAFEPCTSDGSILRNANQQLLLQILCLSWVFVYVWNTNV